MKIISWTLGGLFSIYEDKKSSVVIVLLCTTGFGLYKMLQLGDIPDNVTKIILVLSGLIFGVNSISTLVAGLPNNQSQNINTSETNCISEINETMEKASI
jgi:hypothetical protein